MDRGSIRLVQDLYRELLPHFLNSTLFHVGFDEVADLGKGRSRDACQEHGTNAVFFQYLLQVRQAAKAHGRTVMIWYAVARACLRADSCQCPTFTSLPVPLPSRPECAQSELCGSRRLRSCMDAMSCYVMLFLRS